MTVSDIRQEVILQICSCVVRSRYEAFSSCSVHCSPSSCVVGRGRSVLALLIKMKYVAAQSPCILVQA